MTAHVASVDLYQFYQGKGGTNTRPQYSSALFFLSFSCLCGTLRYLFRFQHRPPPFFFVSLPLNSSTFSLPSPDLPLSLSSAGTLYRRSLYRGNKLLAIPVTDSALMKYSRALSTLSLSLCPRSLLLTLPLALVNVIAQASCLAGNQALFAQYFGDCCCTIEKKRCIMIVLLLYLLNDEAI